MPGMAANPKIFEFLNFSKKVKVIHLSWIDPYENESLSNYAKRMCKYIKHKNPILLGVSFGGILVQEMAKYIECRKTIIVSSIKSKKEMSRIMKINRVLGIHKLIPFKSIKNLETLILFSFGFSMKKKILMYQKYLTLRDPKYLSWAINSIVNWEGSVPSKKLIHIHGNEDKIFRINRILDPYIEIEGDHAIILTRFEWFNDYLSKII